MESLEPNEYRNGARLMTVASHSSRVLDAASVEIMLEHRGKEGFLRNRFLVAVFEGCHRRPCIQKLVKSGQPGTEWVLQPTRTNLIRASEFELLLDHDLIKMSSSAN